MRPHETPSVERPEMIGAFAFCAPTSSETPDLLHLLVWYALTLPVGYILVARYWPSEPLSWREFGLLAGLVLVWPLTGLAILADRLD